MSSNYKIRRRQLLLGAAAGLAQTTIPASVKAQWVSPRKPLNVPPHDFIPPDPAHPYFKPQGGPLTKPLPLQKRFDGEGLPQNSSTNGKGALLDAEPVIEEASASSSEEGLIQTAAFTVPALSLDDTDIETVATTPTSSALVLYDVSGQWGWLGEIYAIMVGNLVSHFGSYTLLPVSQYTAGLMSTYKAVIYIGSTYEEANFPAAFLTDVPKYQSVNVVWIFDNIWKLTTLSATYGWTANIFEFPTTATAVSSVTYKGVSFKRYAQNADGVMTYGTVGAGVTVLANCVRANGTQFPWALRSKNLTYIGENPLSYLSEGDRYLVFCDLLFDAMGATPATTQYRAILRLEDNDYQSDPTKLKQVADWLKAQGVPFGYHIVPHYKDPTGYYNNGVAQDIPFNSASVKSFRDALVYFQGKGGTPILHGWTHQYYNAAYPADTLNPETGVSADDAEFFRFIWNASTATFTYAGPLPEDLTDHANKVNTWAAGRMTSALTEIGLDSRVTKPTMFTTPHYLGTATTVMASTAKFAARAERVLYYSGLLAAKAASPFDYTKIDYTKLAGQYFPYSVKDIYGGKVLPDTLGSIEPTAYLGYAARLPADIIADAARIKAVRDGVAAFQYHSYLDISYLQTVVTGLKNLGYTFVAPTTL